MNLKTTFKYYLSQKAIANRDNKDLVIMSFNIRCISKDDTGKHYYKIRMPYIRKILEEENPDVVGFQEPHVRQFKYLKKILRKYGYEYKKRDTKKDGEANPVFFKTKRFTCLKKGTFWLSDTYQIMSNTFNGRCLRICSYVCLKDKTNNQTFCVFNTHLDHVSEIARLKGVQLIKKLINDFGLANLPHLIIGDMNDFYHSTPINELFLNYQDASLFNQQQEIITFHGYGTSEQKIDYIAMSKNIKQLDYKVITKKFNDIYPSDHYPIEVSIALNS